MNLFIVITKPFWGDCLLCSLFPHNEGIDKDKFVKYKRGRISFYEYGVETSIKIHLNKVLGNNTLLGKRETKKKQNQIRSCISHFGSNQRTRKWHLRQNRNLHHVLSILIFFKLSCRVCHRVTDFHYGVSNKCHQ